MSAFPIDPALRYQRLQPPTLDRPLQVAIDTDTYNEIDDQFAVVYALLSPERIQVEGTFAAPFLNNRSTSAEDGMEKSYEEILRVLDRMGRDPKGMVFKGSRNFLKDRSGPDESDAARRLVELAMDAKREEPLYVLALGAISNVASALLMEPRICEKIVVVWLGGHRHDWPDQREFNLKQDVVASRAVFDSGVPMVQVPAMGVTSHLLATAADMDESLKGKNAIATYLCKIFRAYQDDHFGYAKEIWDIAAPAFCIDPSWTPSHIVASPILNQDCTLSYDAGRHPIRILRHIRRNAVFKDMYAKIAAG